MEKSVLSRAPVCYHDKFLSDTEANELFKELESVNIERHTHQGRKLGRNTAVFGDDDWLDKVPPKIWGDNVKILGWTPVLKTVLAKVKKALNDDFNVCLVNSYENGKEYIGWHADNEEKGSTYCIASISLGSVRKFSFIYRSKELGGDNERVDLQLGHGSLVVMRHPCQDKYLHSLIPDKKIKEKRINLTFRKFHYNNDYVSDVSDVDLVKK